MENIYQLICQSSNNITREFILPSQECELKAGVYKVPHSPPLEGGSLSNPLGKNFKL